MSVARHYHGGHGPTISLHPQAGARLPVCHKTCFFDMLNLVLFGAPGSGKGTQSAKIIDEYGLHHISTGDVLRSHIARKTPYGKTADAYISKGELIPDELMMEILRSELDDRLERGNGVVFDGFPRTVEQARRLEKLLEEKGTRLHAVVGLDVPEADLMERLLKRGRESGRADDNEETIKNRLKVYHSQTEPLRRYYQDLGKFIDVNGKGVVDDIFADIADGIEETTGVKTRHALAAEAPHA